MKFNDLLFDIVTEEFQNKKILNTMLLKWYGHESTEEQRNECEFLISSFFKVKERFKPELPEVRTFLNRFPEFKVENLKNVLEYTLQQVKFIVSEYFELPNKDKVDDNTPEIFMGRNLPPTPERVTASKDLWFKETDNLMVNEPGFRVYKIRNRADSINWGYYNGYLSQNPPYSNSGKSHMQWCTTRHVTESNLYAGYRNRRTFYFVIDESKNPDIEKNLSLSQYYISALQASDDSPTGFRITTILNDGSDRVISTDELTQIYPKLYNDLEKLTKVKYDQSELGEITDDLDRVDEREGNDFAFWRVNTTLKKRYIDAQRTIVNPKSWETMNDGLKQSYIDYTEKRNAIERFSTMDLLNKIKSIPSDKRSLDAKLQKLGYSEGSAYLFTKIFQTNFQVLRTSMDFPSVKIFESRTGNSVVGIFDESKGEWCKAPNGAEYLPEYIHINTQTEKGKDMVNYLVDVYSKSMNPTDDSFYIVYPITDENYQHQYMGHFLSASSWKKFSESMLKKPNDHEEPVTIDRAKEFQDIYELG